MTVAEAVRSGGDPLGGPFGSGLPDGVPAPRPLSRPRRRTPSDHPGKDAALAADRKARRERVRQQIEAAHAQGAGLGALPPSLPPGVFTLGVDAPDKPDIIYTIAGYVSLPYAAALFGVHRQRLQEAVWRGAIAGVKTDSSRTAPWMVRVWDVARYLGSHTVLTDRARGGRQAGRNLSRDERRFAAATLEIWRQRHAPWMTPEESAQLGERLESEAS